MLPTLEQGFRENPLEALAEVRDVRSYLLGHDLFERRAEPCSKDAVETDYRCSSSQLVAKGI